MRRTINRRTVLLGGIGLLAGCRSGSSPARRPTVAPDAAVLARARDDERAIIAAFDATIRRAHHGERPRLLAARAAHEVHLRALLKLAPGRLSPMAGGHDIDTLLRASTTRLQSAAQGAATGEHAALLASLAASHGAALAAGLASGVASGPT
jgi:hypothetical protein